MQAIYTNEEYTMKVFPVTTSTVSAKALGEFAKEKYGLNNNYVCSLFRTGMNHTYVLSDNETKYVLRLYCHNWRTKPQIEAEIKLLNLLKDRDMSISFPIRDKADAFIQEINAPEGLRYAVLFSFAEGEKMRHMNQETCFSIGSQMAKFHTLTIKTNIERDSYNKQSLIELPYEYLNDFFPDELPEMEYIKKLGAIIQDSDFENIKEGVVHLDMWYDNMAVKNEHEITIFDFDFCGNGWHILDIGYFCKQLFFIETDKKQYELKVQSFLTGYEKIKKISDKEIKLLPKAGASVFLFYLGVQAQRFDWSNLFLTENYLKMYVGRIKYWIDYYQVKEVNVDKN